MGDFLTRVCRHHAKPATPLALRLAHALNESANASPANTPDPGAEVARDVTDYDVVTVGAHPAGLAFAIRQVQQELQISVCV